MVYICLLAINNDGDGDQVCYTNDRQLFSCTYVCSVWDFCAIDVTLVAFRINKSDRSRSRQIC